jgi:hypothetical protein
METKKPNQTEQEAAALGLIVLIVMSILGIIL